MSGNTDGTKQRNLLRMYMNLWFHKSGSVLNTCLTSFTDNEHLMHSLKFYTKIKKTHAALLVTSYLSVNRTSEAVDLYGVNIM